MSAQRKATGPKPGARRKSGGAKKGAPAKKSLPRRILKWLFLAMLAGIALGAAAFAYGYASTGIPDPNKDFQAQTTFVYYADGNTELGRFATQNRVSIPLADVPQHVQDAVIAAEDRSFYTNRGIDPKGILRAAFSNASGGSTQGGSTITQQYVKVLYLSQERTITRKVKEAFLSLKIQRQESKQEILQGYLNTIYFGRGAYGIEAAAHAFFDKPAADLTLREGAALASVLNSPGNLDPAGGKTARQSLLGRYQYVLNGMADADAIPADRAANAARKLPKFPKIKAEDRYGGQRGYMLDMVKDQLREEGFSDAEIEGGGLRVTTTFTRKAMEAATQAVKEQRPPGLKQLHVAVASIDPQSGALRGMFAGQDFVKSNGGINWAKAGGQPGSAFKPFALAAGIKDGFSLKSTFDGNSPYVFPDGSDVVNEGPFDGTDYGSAISLLTATEKSVNTAFIDLTVSMDNGPQKILDMANQVGIPKGIKDLKPTSGISLGSAKISTIDMANGFATIANGGQRNDWFVVAKVESVDGSDLFKQKVKPREAIPQDIDDDVSYALQQVVKSGTGSAALALGRPAAGKTGTATNAANDVSSSWFVGYTPQLSTAVMYVRGDGNDALNGYMPSYFGADYPARTWTAMMQKALEGAPIEEFPPPANVLATNTASGHAPLPTFTPKPTPTKTPSPSPTPTPTPTPTPSPTPTPTPSPSPSATCTILGGCPTQTPTPGGGQSANSGDGNGQTGDEWDPGG